MRNGPVKGITVYYIYKERGSYIQIGNGSANSSPESSFDSGLPPGDSLANRGS